MVTLQCIETRLDRELPWCAVYTRHQHEKTIGEMLKAKGFEIFVPLYESTRRWKDRRKVLSLPLFPCYVFVRGAHERRLQVLTTPGVHMIISRGEQIATIQTERSKRFGEQLRRTSEWSRIHTFVAVSGFGLSVAHSKASKASWRARRVCTDWFCRLICWPNRYQSRLMLLDVVPVVQKAVIALQRGESPHLDSPRQRSLAGD